tara:strand:+ start:7378 stop:9207 length:1830 start_codon:yes stop_codon:yes gene_type:complete
MADKTLFGRLQRLFSTNVIVRNVGGKKLKVADTEQIQSRTKSHLVDRYSKLHSGLDLVNSGYSSFAQLQAARLGLFKDYESMEADSIIASALDIYADECTMKNPYGEVLEIQSDNDNIKSILHNLFYDIMNIEFNLWPWIRNLTKYGDFFLYLDVEDKYGITNVIPVSAYELVRSEGEDPDNPYYVKFYMESQETAHPYFTRSSKGKKIEFENFQIAHFRLASDSNLLPYGKSMLESARKVWKQVTLMEDAMLIHRIMRAPEKRVFKVDIGNIPPNEVDNYMQRIINKMKKTPFMDEATGDYNLKFNIQNLTEDFFMPVRGGDSGTNIESLPGMQYDSTEDIEYLKNRMLAALHVPKAFLGYEESLGSKATLAAEDVRFARTIERIQRIVVSELTKIAVVHLYSQGYTDAELVNFELNLTNPSTIYEQEKIELWSNKINLARDMKDNNMMSTEWIYKNIFGFSDDQIKEVEKELVQDQKQKFRFEQISIEGNDPVKSGDAVGTPSDMASASPAPEGEQPPESLAGSLFDDGGSPEGGFEGAGRPKEVTKYGKDGSARGRDPLGRPKIPMALAHYDGLKKSFGKKAREVLKETMDSEEITKEYEDFKEEK